MLSAPKRPQDRFEQVALPHLPALYGLAKRLTRNERDAEDLVQDAILRAYRFFDSFEPGTNCKAWLFKILHNAFINKYRRGVRDRYLAAQLSVGEGEGSTVSHEVVQAARDPEGTILGAMVSEDVRRALDALPEEFRVAVILSDLEELSYREIADVMESPIGTVMSRLYRGRRLLQAALHGYAVEQGIVKGTLSVADGAKAGDLIPFPPRPSLEGKR
ncbi:MAG: sigma-70 family RNA polymerase sigma factor [Myxococcales bacterium]|nr:sigma-70 family RNA polymerase sigma factor [Myxococcales bacterium]